MPFTESRGLRSIRLKKYPIYIGEASLSIIPTLLAESEFSKLAVLVDTHTRELCLPVLKSFLPEFSLVEMPAGEENKNLESVQHLWSEFTRLGIDRNSLVLNLGGGVVTDLGGFAEASFKRGVQFWNIPTTLMGMVDASLGGKTGIDLLGFKNHVGVFRDPACILVYPAFLKTLSPREIRSGFAEIIKHGLIRDADLWKMIRTADDPFRPGEEIIGASIWVKADLVQLDPYERKLRKALNFGHTIGHAIEAWSLEKGGEEILLHGEAVAAGMICESHISFQKGMLYEEQLLEISEFLRSHYLLKALGRETVDVLMKKISQDKKNSGDVFLFTLLDGIGRYRVNAGTTAEEISASLDYFNSICR